MDLEIMEFRNAINNFVESSNLPDEVKRMVLERVLAKQEQRTLVTVRTQIEKRDKKEVAKGAESI